MNISLSPFAPDNLVSRDQQVRSYKYPSRVSLLILYTQAESGILRNALYYDYCRQIYYYIVGVLGSSRCFFRQKRVYLKTIAGESILDRI